jgi:hypothetical protein
VIVISLPVVITPQVPHRDSGVVRVFVTPVSIILIICTTSATYILLGEAFVVMMFT